MAELFASGGVHNKRRSGGDLILSGRSEISRHWSQRASDEVSFWHHRNDLVLDPERVTFVASWSVYGATRTNHTGLFRLQSWSVRGLPQILHLEEHEFPDLAADETCEWEASVVTHCAQGVRRLGRRRIPVKGKEPSLLGSCGRRVHRGRFWDKRALSCGAASGWCPELRRRTMRKRAAKVATAGKMSAHCDAGEVSQSRLFRCVDPTGEKVVCQSAAQHALQCRSCLQFLGGKDYSAVQWRHSLLGPGNTLTCKQCATPSDAKVGTDLEKSGEGVDQIHCRVCHRARVRDYKFDPTKLARRGGFLCAQCRKPRQESLHGWAALHADPSCPT